MRQRYRLATGRGASGVLQEPLRLDVQRSLDLRQLWVTQTSRVVLPPHVAIDDPTDHPARMTGQQGHLKGRLGRSQRRCLKALVARPLEATPTVVGRASLEEQGWGSQPFSRVDRGAHQPRPYPFALSIRSNAKRAQDQYVDQLSSRVEPSVAQPDMADHIVALDGDQTCPAEAASNHVGPDRCDLPAIRKRRSYHPPDGVPLAMALGSYLHAQQARISGYRHASGFQPPVATSEDTAKARPSQTRSAADPDVQPPGCLYNYAKRDGWSAAGPLLLADSYSILHPRLAWRPKEILPGTPPWRRKPSGWLTLIPHIAQRA